MTKVVTSTANPTVKTLTSLRLRKYRDETGLFLAEGERTVLDALASGAVPRILAYAPGDADPAAVRKLRDACQAERGQCLEVTRPILEKITRRDNPQPIVAAYAGRLRALGDVAAQRSDIVVALDRVRDPGNLGTMIRTADAIGARALVLIGESCDPFAPDSVRASMGSIFNVRLCTADEVGFIAWARRWRGTIAGTAATAAADYRAARYEGPVLALLGTEQSGLSESLAAACTVMVRIPMFGKAESLNLAVAGGIFLYGIRESLMR